MSEGRLEPEFTISGGVPRNVRKLVSCRYQKGCKTNVCACRKDNLMRTGGNRCDEGVACKNTECFDGDGDSHYE